MGHSDHSLSSAGTASIGIHLRHHGSTEHCTAVVLRPNPQLSKSRFVAGLQCPKMLWWRVHEPDAPELTAAPNLQARFDRGTQVGLAARTWVPGGLLIDFSHNNLSQRVAATAQALADRIPVIYEASFLEDGVFVAVDILEKKRNGFVLVEVKSTLEVKAEHLPDVAIQLHVARRAGLSVNRAEVMHLNREYRHPAPNLFVREDVTASATASVRALPRKIRSLLGTLRGALPVVQPGSHCTEPYECPFMARCWPARPKHDVGTLYRLNGVKRNELIAQGYETLLDLPRDFAASGPARRQIQSVRRQRMIVQPTGLRKALERISQPIAFLDFETVSPPIPTWLGCRPYEQIPVQFSCHVPSPKRMVHYEWLARGPGDPRAALASALIHACRNAKTVLAYFAIFERKCIAGLIDAVPQFARELRALHDRIEDLLPIVRDHVYHPRFMGSFGLKDVLPTLVPGMSYDDLKIQDGETASGTLESLLFNGETLSSAAEKTLRRNLLRYCERDTLGMVRLHGRLVALAGQ